MIDPFNITNIDRTDTELEEFAFFCVMVPGHNAQTTSVGLEKFLAGERPFELIKKITVGPPFKLETESLIEFAFRMAWAWRKLMKRLEAAGIGCRTRVSRSIWELAYSGLDLRTCSVDQLEEIHGIGRKTSRFIVLHSRKNPGEIAVLDTHVLQYMRWLGYDAPKSTPQSKSSYSKWEKLFLEEWKKSGKTLAEFDLGIWAQGARKE